MDNPTMTLKARYSQLTTERQAYLDRARQCAKLTIPALMVQDGFGAHSKLYTPFQSVGARGVNNLASKLLLSLLPPNTPFFRLVIGPLALEGLTGREDMRGEIEKSLSAVEREVQSEIETGGVRVPAFEALKQLINSGNVLFYLPAGGGARVFKLDRYVTKRDPMGRVLDTIVKEEIAYSALPKVVQKMCAEGEYKDKPNASVEIYTGIKREGDRWTVWQEAKDKEIPGSRGFYPLDKSPWFPLRLVRVDGEDYGRSYVEEYLGDLMSLEGLSQALVEGSAAAAKMLILVKPNGSTKKSDVEKAPNGAIREGNAEDVTVVQMQKFADFRVAKDQMAEIGNRLGYAFLMNTAIQRNGERVTAEEIRYMAGELEDALGGVYSLLSQEFQLPLVNALMHRMEAQRRLPPLPKELIRPTVVTGIEALGRGHDLNKLDAFLAGANGVVGPENIGTYLKVGEYLKRRGAALGIDMEGLIASDEEVAASQQQQQLMGMLGQLGPNAVNKLGDIIKERMKSSESPEG